MLMIQPSFLFGKSIHSSNISVFYTFLTLVGTLMLSLQSILVMKIKNDITNDVLVEYFYVSQIYINALMFLMF